MTLRPAISDQAPHAVPSMLYTSRKYPTMGNCSFPGKTFRPVVVLGFTLCVVEGEKITLFPCFLEVLQPMADVPYWPKHPEALDPGTWSRTGAAPGIQPFSSGTGAPPALCIRG